MRKIRITCLAAVLTALVLAGCGAIRFTFSFTRMGDKTTVEIKEAEDGDTAESDYISVGKGRAAVIESSLEKGQLQIDFAEAAVFSSVENDTPEDVIIGDVVESVTVGPGDTLQVRLERGDYVYQVRSIGQTSGKVVIDIQKE